MKVMLVPSSITSEPRHQYLTSFLINERVAVDAGSLGFYGSPAAQAQVRHIILTHSHLDHLATLPTFLENTYQRGSDCVTIHATEPVLACLRSDLFNDRIWPDLVRLASPDDPFFRLVPLEEGRVVEIGGMRITPIGVNHPVPTVGLIVEEPGVSIVIATDTGPTTTLWEQANIRPDLEAVFLDAAFPDSLVDLAHLTGHLTPSGFDAEVRKLQSNPRLFAIHLKPRYFAEITAELEALAMPRLEVCRPGHEYEF